MMRKLGIVLCLFIFLSAQLRDAVAQTGWNDIEPIIGDGNIDRLEQLAVVGRGELETATFSPDGNTLAVGTTAGVWFYDFADLSAPPLYLNPGLGYTSELHFDATGNYLQVKSYTPDVGQVYTYLWDISAGVLNAQISSRGNLAGDSRFIVQPDGILWDTTTEEEIRLDVQESQFEPDYTNIVSSPDGTVIALKMVAYGCCTRTGEIQLFRNHTGEHIRTIPLELPNDLTAMFGPIIFSEDYLLTTVIQDVQPVTTTIRAWQTADLIDINRQTITLDDAEILWQQSSSLFIASLKSAQNNILATMISYASPLQAAVMLHLSDSSVQSGIEGSYILLNPRSGNVITLTTDTTAQWAVTDMSRDTVIATLEDFGSTIHDFQFNPDETQLITINQQVSPNWIDTFARLRNTQNWQISSTLTFSNQLNTMARFQPDGRALVIAVAGFDEGSEQTVDLWDLSTQQHLFSFVLNSTPNVSVSPNGQFLFISSIGKQSLYDISDPIHPRALPLPALELDSSAAFFSPGNHYVVVIETNEQQNLLRVVELTTQTEIARMTNQHINLNYFAKNVQWIDNEQVLVLCEIGDQITFWSMAQLRTLVNPTPIATIHDPLLCRIDDDGYGSVVLPTYGAGIQRYNLNAPNSFTRFDTSLSTWWRMAAFIPDSSIVLGAEYGNNLIAWNASNGSIRAAFSVGTWQVNAIDFIQDGSLMVFETEDGTLRVWGVPSERN